MRGHRHEGIHRAHTIKFDKHRRSKVKTTSPTRFHKINIIILTLKNENENMARAVQVEKPNIIVYQILDNLLFQGHSFDGY